MKGQEQDSIHRCDDLDSHHYPERNWPENAAQPLKKQFVWPRIKDPFVFDVEMTLKKLIQLVVQCLLVLHPKTSLISSPTPDSMSIEQWGSKTPNGSKVNTMNSGVEFPNYDKKW